MRNVRSSGTAPELRLRSALWRSGLRFRVSSGLHGDPDIVFAGPKVVVFVDGDFWHGNQWRLRGFASLEDHLSRVNNSEYWISKISRNVARDRKVNAWLIRDGWNVIRIWESEIKSCLDGAVRKVGCAVNGDSS